MDGAVTNFVWDWASGIPEMLVQSPNPQSPDPQSLYLVGHDTLGYWNSASPGGAEDWTYHLPDALGSIRQTTDNTGVITANREWTPFGVEVGTAQGGLGYTGEWYDSYLKLTYLHALVRRLFRAENW